MRISVRMLSIIGALLTLFLFVTAGLVAFSAAESLMNGNISVSMGSPSGLQVAQGAVTVGFPITIVNNSPYDFTDVLFKISFENTTGYMLAESNATVSAIKSTTNATTNVDFIFNYTKFLNDGYTMLLFNDTTFKSSLYFGLTYAYLFGIGLNVNSDIPWGAPLSGFTVGNPQVTPSLTQQAVTIGLPVMFSNHSPFDISGKLTVDLENSTGTLLGGTVENMTAMSGQSFNQQIAVVIPLTSYYSLSDKELTVKLFFSTNVFSYGPEVYRFTIP